MSRLLPFLITVLAIVLAAGMVHASGGSTEGGAEFPRALDSYGDADMQSIGTILKTRIVEEPFNLAATLIFLLAMKGWYLYSKTHLYGCWAHHFLRFLYNIGQKYAMLRCG